MRKIIEILTTNGIFLTFSSARRAIMQNAVTFDDELITDSRASVNQLPSVITVGKRVYKDIK